MAELLNHRHCKNCDRAVALDAEDRLCSSECRAQWAAFQKKRSRTAIFFYVAAALGLLLLIGQLLGRVRI